MPEEAIGIWHRAGVEVWNRWEEELEEHANETGEVLLPDVSSEQAELVYQLLTRKKPRDAGGTRADWAMDRVAFRLVDVFSGHHGPVPLSKFQKIMFFRQALYAAAEMYWRLFDSGERTRCESAREEHLEMEKDFSDKW